MVTYNELYKLCKVPKKKFDKAIKELIDKRLVVRIGDTFFTLEEFAQVATVFANPE